MGCKAWFLKLHRQTSRVETEQGAKWWISTVLFADVYSFQQAKEIASGLEYLHEQNVVHGDLKIVCSWDYLWFSLSLLIIPQDNVIISNQLEAQITDFGVGRILDVEGFATIIERNVRYTAPELMLADPDASKSATPQSDIYSLGILLLQVCPIKHSMD